MNAITLPIIHMADGDDIAQVATVDRDDDTMTLSFTINEPEQLHPWQIVPMPIDMALRLARAIFQQAGVVA